MKAICKKGWYFLLCIACNSYAVSSSETVNQLLMTLTQYRSASAEKQLEVIANNLVNKPYLFNSPQFPLYRTDSYDCQTLVQMSLALLKTKNIGQFEKLIADISYHHSFSKEQPFHYLNKHHFIEETFNQMNEKAGRLTDITTFGDLSAYASTIHFKLDKQSWLQSSYEREQRKSVQKLFFEWMQGHYFKPKKMQITYLSKYLLAIPQSDGSFKPGELLKNIPTPAIAEIVYDPNQWWVKGKLIKERVGTEMTVGHLGILYRKVFRKGEIIYHQINCEGNVKPYCAVTPIYCKQDRCKEILFLHATSAYPVNYYWYQNAKGHYVCSPSKPNKKVSYTACNRVEQRPLFAYLTDYQQGSYWYMNWPAWLGLHIEKIN